MLSDLSLTTYTGVYSSTSMNYKRRKDIDSLRHADALIVMAHPDDEVLFGFIPGLIAGGQSVQLVYTTSGGQGQDKRGLLGKGQALARQRELELKQGLARLGVTRPPILLNFKDGDTSKPENKRELTSLIEKIINKTMPGCIYTFGPDGVTNHPDHITIGEITESAAQKYNDQIPWYCPEARIYQVGFSDDSIQKLKRAMGSSTNAWDSMQSIPAQQLSFKVDIRNQTSKLIEAASVHRTQFNQAEVNGFNRYFNQNPFVEVREVIED